MIEQLERIDAKIVLFINGFNHPILDEIMWLLSSKTIWIPFYLLILYLVYKKYDFKIALLFLVSVALLVFIADSISVHIFKNMVLRFRPSHNLIIQNQLHLYQMTDGTFYKGGTYGFISSHAANFSVITSFTILVLKNLKRTWLFIIPLLLVCYSRIYLGAHYFSDILVGIILGLGLALLMYKYLFSCLKNMIQN